MTKKNDNDEKQYRTRTVKVRMTEDEYAAFAHRCEICDMTQSAMIRNALEDSHIHATIYVSPVNREVLNLLNDLITQGKRIGNNLNQLARIANSSGMDTVLTEKIHAALGDLSEWKYDILKKAGSALGHTETYQL